MNEKVNIQDLIDALAEKHGVTKKDAENFIKEFFLLIEEGLEKDKYVKIKGLGTFKLIEVESRKSVNVNTGEQIEIQGHNKVSFSPENALKEIVNRPFAHFESVVLNDDVNFDDLADNHDAVDVVQGMVVDEMSDVAEASMDLSVKNTLVESVEEKSEMIFLENTNEGTKTESANGKFEDISTEELFENGNQTAIKELIPEAVVKDDNQAVATAIEDTKDENTFMKVFILGVMLVMLICIGSILYMYRYDILPDSEDSTMNREKVVVADSSAVVADTLARVTSDTLLAIDTTKTAVQEIPVEIVRKQPTEKIKKVATKSFEIDSVDHIIVGTETIYTIKEGETLTKVALKFYGTKALWPYIVKYNPKTIKNPNNVPFGTKIRIPKLKKKQ